MQMFYKSSLIVLDLVLSNCAWAWLLHCPRFCNNHERVRKARDENTPHPVMNLLLYSLLIVGDIDINIWWYIDLPVLKSFLIHKSLYDLYIISKHSDLSNFSMLDRLLNRWMKWTSRRNSSQAIDPRPGNCKLWRFAKPGCTKFL